MKQTLFLLAFALLTFTLSAQDFSNLKDVEIKTANECRTYDSAALQCANFIINTPNDEESLNRLIAMSFLIKWMTATPDFTFGLDGNVTKFGAKKDNIIAVYMACMTKYCMENKDKASDKNEVTLNTYHMLATYCSNSGNNVKQNKDLKKMLEADVNGTLKDYLKL